MSESNPRADSNSMMHQVFLGCLIVCRVNPFAKRLETQGYRGVDRHNLTEGHVDGDGNLLTGYLGEASKRLEGIQDIFEFIIDSNKAMGICRFLCSKSIDYDVIACAIDDTTLENLLTHSAVKLLCYEPCEEEKQAFDDAIKRLRVRPSCPLWKSLGFDVAVFGGDFWSLVFRELMGDESYLPEKMVEYRGLLNQNGLFKTREDASRFLETYMSLPERDEHLFVIYQILRPNSVRLIE